MQEPVAHAYFEQLLKTIEWKNDQAIIFGKRSSPNESGMVWQSAL
jgi:hypothetical protein